MNLKLPSLNQCWLFIVKWGSTAAAAYGINVHNLRDMTLGGIVAAIAHTNDSVFNSSKGTSPKAT